jgi:hypothetical protein
MLSSTRSAFLGWRHRRPLNSIEPPWYGPVCPVVWEGRSREAPPYPDYPKLAHMPHPLCVTRRAQNSAPQRYVPPPPHWGGLPHPSSVERGAWRVEHRPTTLVPRQIGVTSSGDTRSAAHGGRSHGRGSGTGLGSDPAGGLGSTSWNPAESR